MFFILILKLYLKLQHQILHNEIFFNLIIFNNLIKFFGFLFTKSILIKLHTPSPFDNWTKHSLSLLGFNPIVSLSNATVCENLCSPVSHHCKDLFSF